MTLLQKASLACISLSTTIGLAADLSRTVLPSNVILCQPASGCTDKVFLGRNYKVLSTPRFVVMVSLSKEGHYTRADVSIANNTGLPLNLFPEDFRVEVISPKPKVLSYVPPANLKDLPAARRAPAVEHPKEAQTTANIDELDEAAKERAALQEAADLEASKKHLPAAPIQPNEVLRGRVYFERDRKAQLVNVVLPIAGAVFEFPYSLQH
jgi:hypothetical protein